MPKISKEALITQLVQLGIDQHSDPQYLRENVAALIEKAGVLAQPEQMPRSSKCMPEGFIHLTPPLELNAHQLRNALDFVNPDGAKDTDQLETNLCIQWRKEAVFEGENFPAGYYAWLTEYPEEGAILLDAEKSAITHPPK